MWLPAETRTRTLQQELILPIGQGEKQHSRVLPMLGANVQSSIAPVGQHSLVASADLSHAARGWTLTQDLTGVREKLLARVSASTHALPSGAQSQSVIVSESENGKWTPTRAELMRAPLSLRVRAKVVVGGWSPWSKWSGRVQMPTLPEQPISLHAEPLSSSAFAVGWSAPEAVGCTIDAYELALCDRLPGRHAVSVPLAQSSATTVNVELPAADPERNATHLVASEVQLHVAADLGRCDAAFSQETRRRVVSERRVERSWPGELITPSAHATSGRGDKVYSLSLRKAIAKLESAASRRRCVVFRFTAKDKLWSSGGDYHLCLRPLPIISSDVTTDCHTERGISRIATTVRSVGSRWSNRDEAQRAQRWQDVACRSWLRRLGPSFGRVASVSLPSWGVAKPKAPTVELLDEHTAHVCWSPPRLLECTYSRSGLFADRCPIKPDVMSQRVLGWVEAGPADGLLAKLDRQFRALMARHYPLTESIADLCDDVWKDDGTRPVHDIAPVALALAASDGCGTRMRSVITEYLIEVRPLAKDQPQVLPSDDLALSKFTRRAASGAADARFPFLPKMDCEALRDAFDGSRFVTVMADAAALTRDDVAKSLILSLGEAAGDDEGQTDGHSADERHAVGSMEPTALIVDGDTRRIVWQRTDDKPPAGSVGGSARSPPTVKHVNEKERSVTLSDETLFSVPCLEPSVTCSWLVPGQRYGWRLRARATMLGWSEWSDWESQCFPYVETPVWPPCPAPVPSDVPSWDSAANPSMRDPLASGGRDASSGEPLLALEAKSETSMLVKWKAPVIIECAVDYFEVELCAPVMDGVEFRMAGKPKAKDALRDDGDFELSAHSILSNAALSFPRQLWTIASLSRARLVSSALFDLARAHTVLEDVLPVAHDHAALNGERRCAVRVRAFVVSPTGLTQTSDWSSIAELVMPLVKPPETLRALAHAVDQLHAEWSVPTAVSCSITSYRVQLFSHRGASDEAIPGEEAEVPAVPVLPSPQGEAPLPNGVTVVAVQPLIVCVHLPVSRTQLGDDQDELQPAVHSLHVRAVAVLANGASIESEWSQVCDPVTQPFLGWCKEDAAVGSGPPPVDTGPSKAIVASAVSKTSVRIDLQACKGLLRCAEAVPEKGERAFKYAALAAFILSMRVHLASRVWRS